MKNKSLGIYVHIPFCAKKCNYCDFCSFPSLSPAIMEDYTEKLIDKFREYSPLASGYSVDTLYFGGGTPTLLPTRLFGRLMDALGESFDISDDAEISCECNPASIGSEGLGELRRMGINRLSIGLQSVHEEELKLLGRIHSFEDFKRTFCHGRDAGFDNISADLMYGLPSQTKESFMASVRELARLAPEHISAYGLKIEEGTPFHRMAPTLSFPDEDEEFTMYESCASLLRESGYRRYEISNFAREGFESRHNLRYWNMEEYIGFGVAAHSYFGGERFGNSRDMKAFLEGEDIVCSHSAVTREEWLAEYVMLRLRLADGLRREDFCRLFGKELDSAFPQLAPLTKEGFFDDDGERVAFTDKGFFVSNYILSDLLDFPSE